MPFCSTPAQITSDLFNPSSNAPGSFGGTGRSATWNSVWAMTSPSSRYEARWVPTSSNTASVTTVSSRVTSSCPYMKLAMGPTRCVIFADGEISSISSVRYPVGAFQSRMHTNGSARDPGATMTTEPGAASPCAARCWTSSTFAKISSPSRNAIGRKDNERRAYTVRESQRVGSSSSGIDGSDSGDPHIRESVASSVASTTARQKASPS